MNTTPSGTRTCVTSSPLGRRLDCDDLAERVGQRGDLVQRRGAISSIRLGLSVRRSIAAAFSPNPGAAATSRALAASTSSDRRRKAAADRRSQRVLGPPRAIARPRDAALARRPGAAVGREVVHASDRSFASIT